ncbi:MAG: ABC transporter permease subunit [Parvibaculaceae bacterium]|nr:ABC transporter permease subunit [Parvibaculaceae bacterium]
MPDSAVISVGRRLRVLPNVWDIVALCLVVGTLTSITFGARQLNAPLETVQVANISLDPAMLPQYALRTTLRMMAALVASLIFTFIYATAAAKSRQAERVLIPILDILQSVPVLGFLSFTVTAFMALFPGSVLGAECAAVFAIFTAQAWNMAFSLYQSLRNVPRDLDEASRAFGQTTWQRFWRLEVPFAMPGLVWNMMMSMSGSWFFIVASEAISVGKTTITLPGIGSYVALAIGQRNLPAIGYAILAMLVVIMAYDQLLFRPLVAWSRRFKSEQGDDLGDDDPWVLLLLRRGRLVAYAVRPFIAMVNSVTLARLEPLSGSLTLPSRVSGEGVRTAGRYVGVTVWWGCVAIATGFGFYALYKEMAGSIGTGDILLSIRYGFYTLARVVVLIILASVFWVPLGIWIGLHPKLSRALQPVTQFLAAFPANLLFPVVVVGILHFHLNPNVWLSPLMILGAQWYILFNVIAGASAFPGDLKEAAASFRVRGVNWWRKVMLPGVFTYFLTGAITASGGCWNASMVAELVSWGDTRLEAQGLGSYIARATLAGDYPRIVLGITVMAIFVTLFNRILWRPLSNYAERRLRLT